jgi:hypothetical protein
MRKSQYRSENTRKQSAVIWVIIHMKAQTVSSVLALSLFLNVMPQPLSLYTHRGAQK